MGGVFLESMMTRWGAPRGLWSATPASCAPVARSAANARLRFPFPFPSAPPPPNQEPRFVRRGSVKRQRMRDWIRGLGISEPMVYQTYGLHAGRLSRHCQPQKARKRRRQLTTTKTRTWVLDSRKSRKPRTWRQTTGIQGANHGFGWICKIGVSPSRRPLRFPPAQGFESLSLSVYQNMLRFSKKNRGGTLQWILRALPSSGHTANASKSHRKSPINHLQ